MPFLATLLAGALALPATDAQTAGTATAKAEAPAKPKKVCRSSQPTGSHLVKRVCRTREEWAAYDKQNGVNTDQTLEARGNGGFNTGAN